MQQLTLALALALSTHLPPPTVLPRRSMSVSPGEEQLAVALDNGQMYTLSLIQQEIMKVRGVWQGCWGAAVLRCAARSAGVTRRRVVNCCHPAQPLIRHAAAAQHLACCMHAAMVSQQHPTCQPAPRADLLHHRCPPLTPQADDMNFELLTTPNHSSGVAGLALCVRKPLVASCGTDCSVRLWNYNERGAELVRHFQDEALSCALHPSGHLIAVSGWAGTGGCK